MAGRIQSKRALGVSLLAFLACLVGLSTARTAGADCSVIAPEGFDQRALLGSVTSPFLTPGLSSDIKVVGAICDQQTRSSAADFRVGGVNRPVNDFVITIAFVGASAPPVLVLASNAGLCGATLGCSTDTLTNRQIAEIPLPGGGVERRLRFRVPENLSRFGPVRLGVKLASDPQPVAFELRNVACSAATGSYVACIDQFYELDGSCRTGNEFVNKPFSGLVALPKTDFTDICTAGCEDVAPGPISSTLPVALDRDGNAVFAMIYADQLVRADRGDGQIEPRPRRLSLSIANAVANGFTNDAPVVYAAKPSSFSFEGFPLSPPFNPFVDPTAPAGQIGIWGMADAEATVHFLPRRACSNDPARACTANAQCGSGATCGAAEFTLAQNGLAVALPVASAEARQAFELNSWLDGNLDDDAVAVAEDERLSGLPINADAAGDDIVVEILDRTTGLLKTLNGLFSGRGLTQVRVVDGARDFVRPSLAAEGRALAFLESEFAEGLANPFASLSGAQALAADANGNNRLDQNLRVFALPDDPAVAQARSLLPASLDLAVLPDGRFDGGHNLVLSEGNLFFAYSPIRQQPHAYQLVNRSSAGVPGNSFAGGSALSSDGRFVAFVSGADNLAGAGPGLTQGVERVYVRDTQTGETSLASALDRASCATPALASDQASGNPDVIQVGAQVYFDSAASLTSDDLDEGSDVYAYSPATCDVENLSAALAAPATNPSGSDEGRRVAFELGSDPQIVLLDRDTGGLLELGPGRAPSLSADGSRLVYTEDVGGVSQIFLVNLTDGVPGAPIAVSVQDGDFFAAGADAASVANGGDTAFETPPGAENSEIFVRHPAQDATLPANHLPTGENVCTASPCGAFAPSISDDGRFVAYVLSGLAAFDEIFVQDLVTGSITPLTRMAGADGHSLEPSLGGGGDFVALTSFASGLAGVAGAGAPNVFHEGPLDPSVDRRSLLGVLDVTACGEGPCTPTLTSEPVTKAASFEGDLAVVGSAIRVIEVSSESGIVVHSYAREGLDVALSGAWLCAIARHDAQGNPGRFAACGSRAGETLSDLTLAGAPLSAREIGLCGDRAIALGSNGVLYAADLASGFAAQAIQVAQDFELGEGVDGDGNGSIDSCLVAFRSREQALGAAGNVGNRDLDNQDLAMFLLGIDGVVDDCRSSATDCPGQACEQFNYQVGREAVVFLVDEADENFGFTPGQDICSPGSDVNEDGLCDVSVRRCADGGSLSEGTSFSQAGNLFSGGGFPDGENTVTEAGYCGTSPENVRFGQLCSSDLDCLAQPGETCQEGFVVLSALADTDGDEIPDVFDNCPDVANPDQANSDADDPLLEPDEVGDACDAYTCGDAIVQDAEECDEGASNGLPGSSCSATCGRSACEVAFKVLTPVYPRSILPTPISVLGSACLNLDTKTVGGVAPRSIDANSLRLSATPPTQACPTSGGAPFFNLSAEWFYRLHVFDLNRDGIKDLNIGITTRPIGATSATKKLYLTGRFRDAGGPLGNGCFVAEAPVKIVSH